MVIKYRIAGDTNTDSFQKPQAGDATWVTGEILGSISFTGLKIN